MTNLHDFSDINFYPILTCSFLQQKYDQFPQLFLTVFVIFPFFPYYDITLIFSVVSRASGTISHREQICNLGKTENKEEN